MSDERILFKRKFLSQQLELNDNHLIQHNKEGSESDHQMRLLHSYVTPRRLYSKMTTFPPNTFSIDRFRCVKVDINILKDSDPTLTPGKLEENLRESEKSWLNDGIRAIWFNIPTPLVDFVPTLVKNEFKYHHAKPEYISLVKWISREEPNNIPTYPYTNVGVGGLVIDSKDRVLVVQEKYKVLQRRNWKFPGGFSNQGEDISATAEREVQEETGIRAKFDSIVAFRHLHRFQFGGSDIYVICGLSIDDSDPKSLELTKCNQEIHDVKWMPVEDAKEELSEFNSYVLEKYLESKRTGFSIGREDVKFILGGSASVYSVHKKKQ